MLLLDNNFIESNREKLYRARVYNFPIRMEIQKLYNLYVTYYVQFPKEYKQTLGKDLGQVIYELRKHVNHALKVYQKQTALRDADSTLECLRDIVWCCFEKKCLSAGQLGLWAEQINVIGVMLGGWLKEVLSKKS